MQSISPTSSFWNTVVADPGPDRLFVAAIYLRGGAFLEALRRTVGDTAFSSTLRQWAGRSATVPVSTDDFQALAESVSGQDLDALFTDWLHETGKPTFP